MPSALDHARALVALLEAEAQPEPSDDTQQAPLAVQIDVEVMAELVEMAAHLGLSPSLTLKLALRALAAELAKGKAKAPGRLVGAQRGMLEGKR